MILLSAVGCNPQLKRTVLDKAPVSGILAILSSGTYSLNVSVSGLVSPVEIKNHRSEILQISQNGKFQFPSKLSSGENYTVSISGTMSGQICSFDQSSGTAGSGDAAVAMTCTASEILPFFANAPAWNDYVKNDGTSVQSDGKSYPNFFLASGTACAGTEQTYKGCFHGGFYRKIVLSSLTDCTGIRTEDNLGIFGWGCGNVNGKTVAVNYAFSSGKNLADLVQFDSGSSYFKENYVRVYKDNVLYYQTTPSKTWWTNQFEIINNTGEPAVWTSGKIYTVGNGTAPGSGFSRSPILASASISKFAILAVPGVLISVTGGGVPFIEFNGNNFVWLEGNFNAGGIANTSVIKTTNVRYSVFRNIRAAHGGTSGYGLDINSSDNNEFINIIAASSGGGGTGGGIKISTSSKNLFYFINAGNNDNNGIQCTGSNSNMYLFVIHTNNRSSFSFGCSNQFAANAVSANSSNFNSSFALPSGAVNNFFLNLGAFNPEGSGFDFTSGSPSYNEFLNFGTLAQGNVNAIGGMTGSSAVFRGNIVIASGKNCAGDGVDGSCNPLSGDAVRFSPASVGTPFLGALKDWSILDTSNSSDALTAVAFGTGMDAYRFDTFYRNWGAYSATNFAASPGVSHEGNCLAGNCTLYSFDMWASQSVFRGINACPESLPLPSLEHKWESAGAANDSDCQLKFPGSYFVAAGDCRSLALRNAVELIGDSVGNENGICEKYENCIYSPNLGAYQGHGSVVSATSCSPVISSAGINLYQFQINGY
ncbi:MAG TPA: hypothetical protein PKA14_00885 [Leptospiraceae bacterium]|nr:hypothetical protein [Leptospiraceae bacterium]